MSETQTAGVPPAMAAAAEKFADDERARAEAEAQTTPPVPPPPPAEPSTLPTPPNVPPAPAPDPAPEPDGEPVTDAVEPSPAVQPTSGTIDSAAPKKAKTLTEYVVQAAITKERTDDPPRGLQVLGVFAAMNPGEAKRKALAESAQGTIDAAAAERLWLVAVPLRSFKNLKRVEPAPPTEPTFRV